MTAAIDITGLRSGKLVAIEPVGQNKLKQRMWRLRCDCGGEKIALAGNFRAGGVTSCGCGRSRPKHGYTKTRIYRVWCSMKQRCFGKKHPSYHRYGGRGIGICAEWMTFEPFAEWAFANGYAEHLQIDRINNDAGYEPSNCRFVTPAENQANRSCSKSRKPLQQS